MKSKCMAPLPGPFFWSFIANGPFTIFRQTAGMDDTISIRCKRCLATFRDRARRVQPGYSRQCPSCQALLLFEEHITDPTIQFALRDARKLRRVLREAEDAKAGG
jgi:hypothetical protein